MSNGIESLTLQYFVVKKFLPNTQETKIFYHEQFYTKISSSELFPHYSINSFTVELTLPIPTRSIRRQVYQSQFFGSCEETLAFNASSPLQKIATLLNSYVCVVSYLYSIQYTYVAMHNSLYHTFSVGNTFHFILSCDCVQGKAVISS